MRRALPYALLAVLFAAQAATVGSLSQNRAVEDPRQNPLYAMPSPVLKIVALDFDGMLSDYLFFEGITYLGGQFEYAGNRLVIMMDRDEWKWFGDVMDVSTDLDPYFQDPYYLVNAFLPWDAGEAGEANRILEKGSKAREWDWTMPFFIGFNAFYFLQDNDTAARSLMDASRRPLASPNLASLASKLMFKTRKTEAAVLFLREIVSRTDDEGMKQVLETRLKAFEGLLELEEAADAYHGRFKRVPRTPADLVQAGLIKEVPVDPYGGSYYIDEKGAVRMTSEEQLMPYLKKK